MRLFIKVAVLVIALLSGPLVARAEQDGLTGKWNGKLDLPTRIIPLEFDFSTDEGGSLKGTVRYPGTNIRQTALSNIAFSGGVLSFTLGTAEDSYQGRLSGHQFIGELKVGSAAVPLAISKGEYDDYILRLPDESRNALLGQWYDEVRTPTGGIIIAYRFEIDAADRLVGFADVPEQQQLNMPITNAVVEGENLSFEVPSVKGRFEGEIRQDKIIGNAIDVNGQTARLSLKKGQYEIPYALDLSKEEVETLLGRWEGQIEVPGGTQQNIFRFAMVNGAFYGYVDNPTSGLMGMKINRLSLKDGTLRLETVSPPGKFSGDVSGNDIHGRWVPGGQNLSLSANYHKVR